MNNYVGGLPGSPPVGTMSSVKFFRLGVSNCQCSHTQRPISAAAPIGVTAPCTIKKEGSCV